MSKNTTVQPRATMRAIRSIARQIARQFRPQKIVLFGSRAHGRPTSDSDVDLLVIMETKGSVLREAGEVSKAVPHPFPLDILVRTPSQIAEGVEEGDFFILDMLSKGRTLYEEGNERMADQG